MSKSSPQDHVPFRTTSFAPICETCVHSVPSCYNMSSCEKSSIWYNNSEISFFKNTAKFVGSVFRSSRHVKENDIDKILKLKSSQSLRDNLFMKFLMSYYPGVNPDCVKTDALQFCPRGLENRIFPERKSNKEAVIRTTVQMYSKDIIKHSKSSKYCRIVLECNKRATDVALASAAADEFYASSSFESSLDHLDVCMSLVLLTPLSQRPRYPMDIQFRLIQRKINWRIHQLSTYGNGQNEENNNRKKICRKDYRQSNATNVSNIPQPNDKEPFSMQ